MRSSHWMSWPRKHGIDQRTYKSVYWNACRYQGRLWALPSTPACVALFYNKTIFRQSAAAAAHGKPGSGSSTANACRTGSLRRALDEIDNDGHIKRAGYLPMEPGGISISHLSGSAAVIRSVDKPFHARFSRERRGI